MSLSNPARTPSEPPDLLEVVLAPPRPAPAPQVPAALSPAAAEALAAFSPPDGLRLGRASAAAWRLSAAEALAAVADLPEAARVLAARWALFVGPIGPERLRGELDDEVRREAVVAAYARSAGTRGMPAPCNAAALTDGRFVEEYLQEWSRSYQALLRRSRGRFGLPGMSAEELCEWLRVALVAALAAPAHFEACARPGFSASLLVMLDARNRMRRGQRVRLVRPEDITAYGDDGRGSPDAARRALEDERELQDLSTRARFAMSPRVRDWYVAARDWAGEEEVWTGRLNKAEIGRRMGCQKSTASRMLDKVREAFRSAGAGDFVRTDRTTEE